MPKCIEMNTKYNGPWHQKRENTGTSKTIHNKVTKILSYKKKYLEITL